MKRLFQILPLLFFLLPISALALDVIPGQKGFGTNTRAAYGNSKKPTIFVVNDLTNHNGTPGDSTRNGISVKTGSFREAINYNTDNKLIVFEVSGTITVQGQLVLDNHYVTIAGQTAPSPGISFRGLKLVIKGHDILVQHIRNRVGDDLVGVDGKIRDGINTTTSPYPYNVVIDHCSISWATDENIGVGDGTSHNITYSNNIISEGLQNSLHGQPHSAGAIIGDVVNVSFISNYFVHNAFRNPTIRDDTTMVFVNNYIYNPDTNNAFINCIKAPCKLAFVGNVVEGGIDTDKNIKNRFPKFWNSTLDSEYYLADSKTESGTGNWDLITDQTGIDVEANCKVLSAPLWPAGLVAMSSANVKDYVLANAGTRPEDRDAVDSRLINDAINDTGTIKDCVSGCARSAGGYPSLAENKRTLSLPANPHSDDDRDGYTNLEEWLHGLAALVEVEVGRGKPGTSTNMAAPKGFTIKTAKES